MSRARNLLTVASIAATTLLAPTLAHAQKQAPPPTAGTLGAQIVELAGALQPQDETCTAQCYTLEHLQLSGDLRKGALDFVLEGSLLTKDRNVSVLLFGTPAKVRIENATENGQPATLGFAGDRYFLHPSTPHFVLRGTIVLSEDRVLELPTPLNRFDAKLEGGRVTEGNRLSGLESGIVHFDAEDQKPAEAPTIFSLSRALRVKKNVEFEYRLLVQGSSDLGMVHLPLRYGERVLDVTGSNGWKVEGEELLLPTTGKGADVTITGVLANVGSFTPDPRSPFEWWLLESDADHRILATGDAKQHDSSESPIARKEGSSRLFMVTRGQKLDITVQALATMDVLSAVVRSHERTVVLTAGGELVAQDTYAYENTGIDYLRLTPDGKPIYLSIDGSAERLVHKEDETELMIPLRTGSHQIVTESIDEYAVGLFGGRRSFAGPKVPLATGREWLTIGLPSGVHPVVVTGGDQTQWPLGRNDAFAVGLAAALSLLLLRGGRRRALGVAALSGLWFFSHPLFVATMATAAVGGTYLVVRRMTPKARKWTLGVSLVGVVVVGLPLLSMMSASRSMTANGSYAQTDMPGAVTAAPAAAEALDGDDKQAAHAGLMGGAQQARLGNFMAQNATVGMIDGVRPVSLGLPTSASQISISRELVTAGRPFAPTLYYVTDTGLALLGLLWLTCAAGLAWSERERLATMRDKMRVWLQPKPEAAPAPAPEAPAAAE